jgi:WD40 repeat protein
MCHCGIVNVDNTLTKSVYPNSYVRSMHFSPGNRYLLINTSWDGYEEIEVETCSLRMFFADSGVSLGYSGSGASFLIDGGKELREYDSASCLLLKTTAKEPAGKFPPLERPRSFSRYFISPDERELLCAGNEIWVWDLQTGKPSEIYRQNWKNCYIQSSGRVARAGGYGEERDLNRGTFVSLPTGSALSSFKESGRDTEAVSDDSKLYASLCKTRVDRRDLYELTVRDVASASILKRIKPGNGFCPEWRNYYYDDWPIRRGFRIYEDYPGIIFSRDGESISVQDSRKGLLTWSTAPGRGNAESPSKGDKGGRRIMLSPCGRWGMERIFGTGGGNSVMIWDIARGKVLARAVGLEKNSPVRKFQASPGGRWLLLQHSDYRTSFLSLESGQLMTKGGYVAALSRSDRYFLLEAWNKTMQVIDGATLTPVCRLDERYPVLSGAFAGNGRVLVSEGRRDSIMRIWDGDSGRLRGSFAMFGGGNWIVWTPEGLYDGSPGAGKYITWNMGTSLADDGALRASLSRPGLLATLFR